MARKRKRTARPATKRGSLEEIGKTTSQVVQEAAAVLEEDLATGLIAARKVSQRLAKEQRFEADDFADALKRFRSTGHELIEIARGRLEELRSDANQELLKKLLTDGQGALDTLIDVIAASPELADRFLKTDQKAKSRAKR
jgi:hypothetical protein